MNTSTFPSVLSAPGDYDSGPYTVTFTAGQDSAIVMVQTVDDSTLELNEYFKIMITSTDRPDKVQPGDPDTSYITILDNEPGEYKMQLVIHVQVVRVSM